MTVSVSHRSSLDIAFPLNAAPIKCGAKR